MFEGYPFKFRGTQTIDPERNHRDFSVVHLSMLSGYGFCGNPSETLEYRVPRVVTFF